MTRLFRPGFISVTLIYNFVIIINIMSRKFRKKLDTVRPKENDDAEEYSDYWSTVDDNYC